MEPLDTSTNSNVIERILAACDKARADGRRIMWHVTLTPKDFAELVASKMKPRWPVFEGIRATRSVVWVFSDNRLIPYVVEAANG